MALTFTNVKRSFFGDQKVVHATATFDSSYPTGGESIVAADLGMSQVDQMHVSGLSIDDEALGHVVWDRTNEKLIVIVAVGTQEGNATDLSATTCEITAFGK